MSACPSVRPSVHKEQLGSHGEILMKFDNWAFFFFEKSVEKIQV
jgi:hypothetical protein